jgi:predicted metal-dependent hydrolase
VQDISSSHNHRDLKRAFDLFNRAHFFEAHKVLEDVWRALPRTSAARKHLQGLIQLAVAFHHESRGNSRGARSVLARALRNLSGAEVSFPALDLKQLRSDLADWQKHLAGTTPRPARPQITFC